MYQRIKSKWPHPPVIEFTDPTPVKKRSGKDQQTAADDSKLPMLLQKSHQLLHPYFHAPPPSHLLTGLSLLLTLTESHKFGILFVEEQIDRIDRAVTVLGDDQLGDIFIFRFRIIVIFTV